MEHDDAPAVAAQPTAEILHPTFAQPKPTASIDFSRSIADAIQAKLRA
jgi:hypothetical protein